MPPGMPWAYGQSMSMRNPMSRAPMNNNPMGVQAPMTPNYGAASGAAAMFQPLPYAGRALGAAGPASAVGGMVAGQSAMSRPAPRPQGSPYMRAMSGDPIYGQNGIGVQRSAQNVLMGQPMDADTRMRGLNMSGMQKPWQRYASRGITPGSLTGQFSGMEPYRQGPAAAAQGISPDEFRVGMNGQAMYPPAKAIAYANANGGQLNGLSGGSLSRSDDQRWARMARQAGVRPQDMQTWRNMKMRESSQYQPMAANQGASSGFTVVPNVTNDVVGGAMSQAVSIAKQAAASNPFRYPNWSNWSDRVDWELNPRNWFRRTEGGLFPKSDGFAHRSY